MHGREAEAQSVKMSRRLFLHSLFASDMLSCHVCIVHVKGYAPRDPV